MANDGNIDSRGLTQGDSEVRPSYRTNSGLPIVDEYDFLARQSKIRENNLSSNGYSHCQHRTRVTRSGSDVRIFDDAINSERLEYREEFGPIIEANCGDSSTLIERVSALSISPASHAHDNAGDQQNNQGRDTYRCEPVVSPPTTSTISSSRPESKSSVKVRCCTIGKIANERSNDFSNQPEVQRYSVNGRRVVEFSASSVSGSNISERQGSTSEKNDAREKWAERKKAAESRRKEEARRREEEKQAEEERLVRDREERERRERENFVQWAERKKKEEAEKREIAERELKLERQLKEIEDKTVMAKTIHLRQWARNKEKLQIAQQRKRELRQKREEEERRKRLEESSKAYEKWRETSKNRPRPATQGLLPHQKATPSYINPIPWVVDDVVTTETSNSRSSMGTRRSGTGQTKSNVEKSVSSKQ